MDKEIVQVDDEKTEKAILCGLHDKQIISRHAICEKFGIDYHQEIERVRTEWSDLFAGAVGGAVVDGCYEGGGGGGWAEGWVPPVHFMCPSLEASSTDSDKKGREKRLKSADVLMHMCKFDRDRAKELVSDLAKYGFNSDTSAKDCLKAINDAIKELESLRDVVEEMQ